MEFFPHILKAFVGFLYFFELFECGRRNFRIKRNGGQDKVLNI